jgi:mannose-6-phosphate isomerase-like protein (cupin superfamily)
VFLRFDFACVRKIFVANPTEGTLRMATQGIWRYDGSREFATAERCYIVETYNSSADESLSIARARVAPGVTTGWHTVEGTVERYVIVEGRGRVEAGGFTASEVGCGDIVVIPAGMRQRIANIGNCDLIFYCVCTPRFQSHNYRALD